MTGRRSKGSCGKAAGAKADSGSAGAWLQRPVTRGFQATLGARGARRGRPLVLLLLNNRHPSPVFELFVPVGGGGMTSGIRRADSIGISF